MEIRYFHPDDLIDERGEFGIVHYGSLIGLAFLNIGLEYMCFSTQAYSIAIFIVLGW